MADGVYNHVTYARDQDHVSLVSQNTQKYATAGYCTKKGYLGPRARRTSLVCATTIIPSHTVVYNSTKLGIGDPWGVQSRHICLVIKAMYP